MPAGRQVLDLLLGDAEIDAVLAGSRYGADRDRHYLAAEHVSLLEEHMGDLMAGGVDDDPLDLPDVAVGGMDVLTAAHARLAGGKGVVGNRRGVREPASTAPLHLVIAVARVRIVALQRYRHA